MIFRLILWLIVGWLAFFLLSHLLKLVPLLLFLAASGVAVCCFYSLLPANFRIPQIEAWLKLESPLSNSSEVSSGGTTDAIATGDSTNPDSTSINSGKPPEPAQLPQPQLDFARIVSRTASLPNRDELRAKLQSRVIGQDAAIEQLLRVVLGHLAAQKKIKPLVVFLPGPTGTGKTELSKALASALGVELIRFDMGEYAESHKASNLFGSAKGYVGSEDGGALPQALRKSKKRAVILFDEVEKAHQSLWRQMLAFFDEGRVTDTLGTATAPKNTICLLTSNLEGEKIAQNPKEAKDIIKESGFFPPEFLGRINKVIPLLRLSEVDTGRLIVVLTKKLADDYGISLIVDQDALETLFDAVYEEAQKYGGRGIKDKVSDLLMDDFIDLQGDRVTQAKLAIKQTEDGARLAAVPII